MYSIVLIKPEQTSLFEEMNSLFSEVFDDKETYSNHKPSIEYIKKVLENNQIIPLVVLHNNKIIGALVAYELIKFEQERSEIYIYDLAVKNEYRRQGVATSLINELKKIATKRDAYVIFVQADIGEEDKPAISLYTKLGTKEEVLHFDIDVKNFT